MPTDRKIAQLKFDGANPMELVESDAADPAEPWSDFQEKMASAVGQATKRYLQATEELLAGKYQHLQGKVPSYLSRPGAVLMAICDDGVVVRYENRSEGEPKKVIAVIRKGIAEVARLLSQNLVHIATPEVPDPPTDRFGVEMKLHANSPTEGTSRELAAIRIWFQTRYGLPQEAKQLGAKPYCLLSVRNLLEIELHGVIGRDDSGGGAEQPFITRSPLRLLAGWECIEVFPTLSLDEWSPDYAPLWAERDILGAALVAQTKDAQLRDLDPRASTRRQYALLLAEFKSMLDSNPEREQILQTFLQNHPALLCPTHVRVWPKLPLGATITDFVFRDANHDYLLVELERSTLPLFRQDGHATADFTHAHGQILDWKRYLEDNLATVQRELGLYGITPNPSGLLVIGRSQSLTPRDRRKLQTMASESPKLRVMTYDDVYDNAKAVLENLLGPIWDTGGTTQIYYPKTGEG